MSFENIQDISKHWWDFAECSDLKIARRKIQNPTLQKSDFESRIVEAKQRARNVCAECIGQIGCLQAAKSELAQFDGFKGIRAGYEVFDIDHAVKYGYFEKLVAKATEQVVELIRPDVLTNLQEQKHG